MSTHNQLGPALAYIFKQVEFEENWQKIREGSDKDVDTLQKTFEKFGIEFKVETDLTVRGIKNKIDESK